MIGFTGARQGLSPTQKENLRALALMLSGEIFIHGGCDGADCEACEIFANCGWNIEVKPGDFKQEAKCQKCEFRPMVCEVEPYLDRNKKIVAASSLLIAAPRSPKEELRSGAWATIRFARRIGKPIVFIH